MHYFGYKYHELDAMDAPTYDYLSNLVIMCKATSDLELKEIVSFPNLKKEDMAAIHRKLYMRATSEEMRAETAVTSDELGAAGISVGSIEDFIKDD